MPYVISELIYRLNLSRISPVHIKIAEIFLSNIRSQCKMEWKSPMHLSIKQSIAQLVTRHMTD